MATHTPKDNVLLLDDRINVLNRDAVDGSPAKQVFRTVSTTLTLVRDKMIDDKDSAQLSEYCFNVREVLKTTIQGTNADGLDESVRVALDDLGRVTREIERALKRGPTKHNKGKIEGHKLKIREIHNTLNAQNTPLDGALSSSERAPGSAPADSREAATTSASGSASRRLVRRAFALDELPSLIEVIFSSKDESDTIRRLLGDDVQAFIDVIDEALDRPDLLPQTRGGCLNLLRKMCGRCALLPTTLKTPISFELSGDPLCRGGYADVWKAEHCGRDIAVKILRTYANGDLRKVIGRFCKEVVVWKTFRHQNVLPLIGVAMSETRFAMVSEWMVNGNINDFVKACPDASRLELLRGVATGLIYIHGQGMVHGDLKGANILIDQAGRARLADFGLLSIISDPKYLLSSSSHTQGGTARWMSPERIAPQRFGFKDGRPSKPSDCYALGMVIYETISGNLPYHKHPDLTVFMMVVEGEHPPRGIRFTETLWKMLELCWDLQPDGRPSIEDVLQCLKTVSSLPGSPSPGAGEEMDEDGNGWDTATSFSGSDSPDSSSTFPYYAMGPIKPRLATRDPHSRGSSPSPHGGYQPPLQSQRDEEMLPPEGFSRPPNAAQSYIQFETLKILNMDDLMENMPGMPAVLTTHDVYHEDWIRFMRDLSDAWLGRLPILEAAKQDGGVPKRTVMATDLVELWNLAFFAPRGVEFIIYKGRERRNGRYAGRIDLELPVFDITADDITDSSDDTERDSEDDYMPPGGTAYGRQDSAALEAQMARTRRKKIRKEERRKRKEKRKEKEARRRLRELERKYTMFLTCLSA